MRNDSRRGPLDDPDYAAKWKSPYPGATEGVGVQIPTPEMQNHQREYRELDPTGGAMRSALLACRDFERAIERAGSQNEVMALRERLAVLVQEFGDAESAALRKADSF